MVFSNRPEVIIISAPVFVTPLIRPNILICDTFKLITFSLVIHHLIATQACPLKYGLDNETPSDGVFV